MDPDRYASKYDPHGRRGSSRATTRQSDYDFDQRTATQARSRATTRPTDREQTDRRTANPPSTAYPSSKGHGTDYGGSSRPAKSKAPTTASTRASTLHPDDSVSNGPYQPRHDREPEARGRSTAPTSTRSKYNTYNAYPPTLSPIPSSRSSRHHSQSHSQRQRSPSITHAHGLDVLDPRLTYTYAGARRSEAPTYRSEASHRSGAPTATTLRSSTSRRDSEAPTHYSSRHSEAPTHRSSHHEGPVSFPRRDPHAPPPSSSYRSEIRRPEPSSSRGAVSGAGSGGGRFTAYEHSTSTWTGTEDEFEYVTTKMSGFSLRH